MTAMLSQLRITNSLTQLLTQTRTHTPTHLLNYICTTACHHTAHTLEINHLYTVMKKDNHGSLLWNEFLYWDCIQGPLLDLITDTVQLAANPYAGIGSPEPG